ncbi:MAG: hypothetical protein V2I40_03515 [Desulfobacteraceae bacterium]|jgi:hypothetical protein|nr:hypothetical protein [Desulfobacteraceae bacterium]
MMITKRIMTATTLMIVLGMMMGCGTTRQMMGGGSSQAMVAESLEAMPPDAALVTRAIGNRLGGYAPPADVRLNNTVHQALGSSNVIEPGFQLQSACLWQYVKTDSATAPRSAEGRMAFQDGLGRRAAVAFETGYTMQGNQAVVTSVRLRPLYDTAPETVCFVLPAKAAALNKDNYPGSFAAFYQYMGERALDPQAAATGKRDDYVMAVFFLNRMAPSAKASLAISSTPDGTEGYSENSRYVDYNGWRIGLMAGCLALNSPAAESSIYLKAFYTPGKEAGLFTSAKPVGVYALAQRQ